MTERDWKPGNVAIRTYLSSAPMVSLLVSGEGCPVKQADTHPSIPHWHHMDGGWDRLDGRSSYRPLVVIDPESDDVERLRTDLIDSGWIPDGDADALDDILREFANPTPPKPEEPTGLGAVVEDAAGNRWVLYTSTDSTAPWCDGATSCEWDEVAAVRVLSEGIQ